MIVWFSRLIVCESDGNMCIPKGRKTENNILEDTTMTKNEDRINKLFKELVPDTGKADSLAGELVRAMSRIGYRFYNDGDQLGIGYGKETCNPAGRFLGAKGNGKIAKLTADAWAVYSEEAYEKVLDILCGAVADYVEQNPDLRNQPTEDMWDFKDEEEDQDDSWDEEEDDWDEEEDYEDEEDYKARETHGACRKRRPFSSAVIRTVPGGYLCVV